MESEKDSLYSSAINKHLALLTKRWEYAAISMET